MRALSKWFWKLRKVIGFLEHSEIMKNVLVNNFSEAVAEFTGKQLQKSHFLNKVAGLSLQLYKETLAQV